MSARDDTRFLALLVHREHLSRAEAERLLPRLSNGESLDDLLVELGWEPGTIQRLRRTQAGEIPDIPGYAMLGKLGSGGTSDVFKAREKKTGRLFALKVLKAECTPNAATRKAFIREARMLEQLDHEGLVKGHGVARSGTRYFSKMEWIDGSTLLELLDRDQAFDEKAALRVILAAADVLRYLGSQGVVHRDVKPGNLMLSQNGRVKLIDLGFAALQDAAAEAEGSTAGTVHYLSPEQARGGARADLRSDIYSLGVTLFHLVVGRLPFESSDDREVLRMQVMESLSSPELKSRGFSPHLHYFVEKMMAKDVELRYQSWEELIGDVEAQLAGRESLDFEREARRDFKGGAPPRR
jgi:eukaryotic-like serine/threonine-protein kinase